MKKQLLSITLTAVLVSSVSFNTKAQTTCPIVPFAVVELFTSQGCSSCPNGDLLISNLIYQEASTGRNVIPIAEHVTYWDHLGWTDQYGMATFGTRQNSYVYTANMNVKGTPQLFVNGKTNVGSTGALNAAVNTALGSGNAATCGVCLSTTSANTAPTIAVNYTLSGNYSGNNLIVCLVENDRTVTPSAGENAGTLLHHDAVARVFTVVPITGATGTVNITPPANCVRAKSRIVAYIQAPLAGSTPNSTIRGATRGLDLSNTALGVQNFSDVSGLKVYPNPAINDIFFDYVNQNINSDIEINLIDISGRIVHTEKIASNGNGEFAKNIDVSGLAKGIYILKVIAENEIINNKIIIE